ncbi:hypothetical protein EMIT0P218_150015 [Pseudomonas sp. IT-P218]
MLVVHDIARLCAKLPVCESSQTTQETQTRQQVSILSIFQITKPNFLFAPDLFKMNAITPVSEQVMNINFAFACMIVVSFTIALVHT